MNELIMRQFNQHDQDDIAVGSRLLFESRGIEIADLLSLQHIQKATECLEEMRYPINEQNSGERGIVDLEADDYAHSLIALALKVKTRKY